MIKNREEIENNKIKDIHKSHKLEFFLENNDFNIRVAREYANKMAEKILDGMPQDERNKILHELCTIFELWMYEHGIYPGHPYVIYCHEGKKPQSAKEYCTKIIREAKKEGKEPIFPSPWQCCPYISTPIMLFEKLTADKYLPLFSFLNDKWHNYSKIQALLIVAFDIDAKSYQSKECVEAALSLASYEMEHMKQSIKKMTPAHNSVSNMRKAVQNSKKMHKEAVMRQVVACHKKLLESDKPFNHKTISKACGISVSMVSRYLRLANIKKYKK